MASSWLRVAVVQFAPKLGEVHTNIAKARELCRGLTPRSVDLVCFPEMIFTGYVFPDAPSIAPYLEHPKTGPTASFCAELARRLECFVVAGYPERLEPTPPSPLDSDAHPAPSTHALIGANAALLYDGTGRLVHTYHKTNLFPTDVTWARPGSGFAALDLPVPLGRLGIAICNDLNVRVEGEGWVSIDGGPYELGDWCVRAGVRVLVVLNAWLRPEDAGMEGVEEGGGRGKDSIAGDDGEACEGTEDGEDGLEPNWQVLNYWALRLRPLWAPDNDAVAGDDAKTGATEGTQSSETSARDDTAHADAQREVIVVVCNRFGRERGKTFAGSSAMFAMLPGSGKPRLLHVMGEREEGVCVWTVRIGS